MFVLKKTFEAMQLEWAKEKNTNEILKRKIDNLTSELNVTYDNLANLEKELNALKGYITFLKMRHNVMSYDEFIKTQNSTNSIVPKKVQIPLTPASDVSNYKLHSGVPVIEKDTSLLVSYDGDMDYNKFNKMNETIKEVSEHISTKCRNGEVNISSFYDDNRNKHNVESSYSSFSYSNDSSSDSSSSSSSSSCD